MTTTRKPSAPKPVKAEKEYTCWGTAELVANIYVKASSPEEAVKKAQKELQSMQNEVWHMHQCECDVNNVKITECLNEQEESVMPEKKRGKKDTSFRI